MRNEYAALKKAYASELRESKQKAEDWWRELNAKPASEPDAPTPRDLWPMGPASHPWVIGTVRKYYFLCEELNRTILQEEEPKRTDQPTEESRWGRKRQNDETGAPVDPKVFVYDLLSGRSTKDLFEFLQLLVFVPIGLKNGQEV